MFTPEEQRDVEDTIRKIASALGSEVLADGRIVIEGPNQLYADLFNGVAFGLVAMKLRPNDYEFAAMGLMRFITCTLQGISPDELDARVQEVMEVTHPKETVH